MWEKQCLTVKLIHVYQNGRPFCCFCNKCLVIIIFFCPFFVHKISQRWLDGFSWNFQDWQKIIISPGVFFHFFKIHFLSSVSCPATKSYGQWDLRNDKDLNIQTLRDDRPIVVDVFKLFCFVRRNFRSSPEALQKLCFYAFNIFLGELKYKYKCLHMSSIRWLINIKILLPVRYLKYLMKPFLK